MAFLPSVPDRIQVSTGLFVSAAFTVLYLALIRVLSERWSPWKVAPLDKGMLICPIYFILSSCWGVSYSRIGPEEAFRAFAPFLMLGMYLPFRYFLETGLRALDLLAACTVSALLTLLYSFTPVFSVAVFRSWLDVRMALESGAFLPTLPAAAGISIAAYVTRGVGHRILWLISSLALSFGMIGTVTRSYVGIIAIIVLGGFCISVLPRFKSHVQTRNIAIIVLLFAVGAFGMNRRYPVVELILSGMEERAESWAGVENRMAEAEAALDVFSQNPLLGGGLGSTIVTYKTGKRRIFEKPFTHNAVLYILYSGGLVGVCFFAYILLQTALASRTILRRGSSQDIRLLLVTLSGLSGWFIYALVQASFRSPQSSVTVAALLSIVGSLNAKVLRPKNTSLGLGR